MSRHVSRLRPIHLENALRIQSIGIRHASGHAPVYRPPTGYMFNEKPPRKGKRRRREDWEPYMWVFFGITLFGVVGVATRPDESIEQWALVQAKLRMEEDGVNLDYKID